MANAFEFDANPILISFIMYKIGDLFKKVKNLVESNEKFDICIIETFAADAFLVNLFRYNRDQKF